MSVDTTDLLSEINSRFNEIEKLIQLILVNNIIDDANQIVEIIEDSIDLELEDMMKMYGLEWRGFQLINGIEVLVVEIPKSIKIKAKDINFIYLKIKQYYPDKEPFFLFKVINGMQRKRLINDEISFGVHGKELHINSGGHNR